MADVSFTNLYSSKIYVAYSRYDPACGADCGDPWDVLGWINLSPGDSQTRPNPTNNPWFYYFAEADDGAFWAGEYLANVKTQRFHKCACLGVAVAGPSQWYDVGMRELDLSQFGGVNFTA
jgi:hypothetical protein